MGLKNIDDNGIRTPRFWLPKRGDAQTYVLFKALTVMLCNMRSLRVMGKIREKEKSRLLN